MKARVERFAGIVQLRAMTLRGFARIGSLSSRFGSFDYHGFPNSGIENG
jgi:hypothetical protein